MIVVYPHKIARLMLPSSASEIKKRKRVRPSGFEIMPTTCGR
jgi:hypothetical protein